MRSVRRLEQRGRRIAVSYTRMSKRLPCQGQRNACRREPSRVQTCTTNCFGSKGSARRCKLQLEHRNSFMLVAVPASQKTVIVWRLVTGETSMQACSVKQGDFACASTTKVLYYQRRALATIHSSEVSPDHARAHCAKNRNAALLSTKSCA